LLSWRAPLRRLHSFPTRRSSDLVLRDAEDRVEVLVEPVLLGHVMRLLPGASGGNGLSGLGTERGLPAGGGRQAPLRWCRGSGGRSEEHTSELQSRFDLVCRLPLE